MQRDSSTYCDEPEETEEFEAWLAGCAEGWAIMAAVYYIAAWHAA